MSVLKQMVRTMQGAVILSMLLAISATAQQDAQTRVAPSVTPTAVSAPAPAPAPSPLFARTDDRAPTIAAAQAANAAALDEGSNHTIRVTTLVLVLGIIILVLLID
jgi:hypothetical protein